MKIKSIISAALISVMLALSIAPISSWATLVSHGQKQMQLHLNTTPSMKWCDPEVSLCR